MYYLRRFCYFFFFCYKYLEFFVRFQRMKWGRHLRDPLFRNYYVNRVIRVADGLLRFLSAFIVVPRLKRRCRAAIARRVASWRYPPVKRCACLVLDVVAARSGKPLWCRCGAYMPAHLCYCPAHERVQGYMCGAYHLQDRYFYFGLDQGTSARVELTVRRAYTRKFCLTSDWDHIQWEGKLERWAVNHPAVNGHIELSQELLDRLEAAAKAEEGAKQRRAEETVCFVDNESEPFAPADPDWVVCV